MSDRVAYPNIGAEVGYSPKRAKGPVLRLIELFEDVVEDPPWRWLNEAGGLVPWLSTTEAEQDAVARGFRLWGAPPAVVGTVHDKAFAVRIAREKHLDGDVPNLIIVLERDEVTSDRIEALVADWPPFAWSRFTVKPRWGSSGRGRVGGVHGIAKIGTAIAKFERGAVVEPWLDRVDDLSSLWFIDEHGEPHLLGTTKQLVRGAGVYLGCEAVITDVGAMAGTKWDEPAIERARVVVEAAAHEGYRGPCGVDAFTWRDEAGAVHLRGVVELNARFTAGHVALGLIARRHASVGTRFRFRLDADEVLTVVS